MIKVFKSVSAMRSRSFLSRTRKEIRDIVIVPWKHNIIHPTIDIPLNPMVQIESVLYCYRDCIKQQVNMLSGSARLACVLVN